MLLSNPKLTITFISHHKSSSPSLTSSFRKSPWCRTGHRLYPTEFVGPRHYIQWGSPQSSRKHWDGQEPLGKRLGGLAVSFFQRGWVEKKNKSPLPSSWVLGVSSPGFQERWVFVGTVQFLVKISQRSCRIINIQRLYQSHFLQKDVHKTHMWKKQWPKLSDISRYEGYGYGEIDLLYRTKMMFNSTNSYSRIFNHSTWPLNKTSQGRLVVMTYLLPVSGKKSKQINCCIFSIIRLHSESQSIRCRKRSKIGISLPSEECSSQYFRSPDWEAFPISSFKIAKTKKKHCYQSLHFFTHLTDINVMIQFAVQQMLELSILQLNLILSNDILHLWRWPFF